MELDQITFTAARALAFSTPLLWAALGEIYAERAGVVNLGVEGMMILGAVIGFIVGQTTGAPYLGLLLAAVMGGLAGLLHAFISITLHANQYISGLALTIFGLGLSGLLGREWVGKPLDNPWTGSRCRCCRISPSWGRPCSAISACSPTPGF